MTVGKYKGCRFAEVPRAYRPHMGVEHTGLGVSGSWPAAVCNLGHEAGTRAESEWTMSSGDGNRAGRREEVITVPGWELTQHA
eukprot:5812916-Amphidinium_carterae.1